MNNYKCSMLSAELKGSSIHLSASTCKDRCNAQAGLWA